MRRTGRGRKSGDRNGPQGRLEQRGLSLSALAKQIGIAQPNLSEMLNGSRGWSKTAIRSLSKLLNIRAERFLA